MRRLMFQSSIIKVNEFKFVVLFNDKGKFLTLLSPSKTASKSGHVYICVFIIINNLTAFVAENMTTL